jgi:23S rRNA pseudouridine1911/1915/1917 synthase
MPSAASVVGSGVQVTARIEDTVLATPSFALAGSFALVGLTTRTMSKTPPPITVDAPSELLARLFAGWPDVKKKQVRTWLKHGAVTVNGEPVRQFDHPLRKGDVVALRTDRQAMQLGDARTGVEIRFEDAEILVVEKPADLLTIATETERERTLYRQLTDALRERRPRSRERIWIVHRLDRETSGLMVFAKTVNAKRALQTGWDEADKRYLAVVEGRMTEDAGTFASHLNDNNPSKVFSAPPSEGTRHAVTHYRVCERSLHRTLVELRLVTGRRHQIRVHLADAGYPVVGDAKYGAATDPAKRLALHASALMFPHPASGEPMAFESTLPRTLARLMPAKRRRNPRSAR